MEFTDEQIFLRESIRSLLESQAPLAKIKNLENSQLGYSPLLWERIVELGLTGINIPASMGGAEMSFRELVVVLEEFGRALIPGPFFSTVVQGVSVFKSLNSKLRQEIYLSHIASGDMIIALALQEENTTYRFDHCLCYADHTGETTKISGKKVFVENANIADKLIVWVKFGPEDYRLIITDPDREGVHIRLMPNMGHMNLCEVIFDQHPLEENSILAFTDDTRTVLERMNALASVAKAAEMLGGMQICVEKTIAYAKIREQYGIPIGKFQVIQHSIADMLIELETFQSLLYRIVNEISSGELDLGAAASVKACADKVYPFITERSVHIHGGMGTTLDGDIGIYYRKAKAATYQCGDSEYQYEMIFRHMMQKMPPLDTFNKTDVPFYSSEH